MGSLIWREGGKRLVVQWYDAQGKLRQKTIRSKSLDGTPLAKRTLERDARRRLAEHELQVDRQRGGLAPITSDVMRRPLRWLIGWWWEHRGQSLQAPFIRAFLEKHLGPQLLDAPLSAVTAVRISKLLQTDLADELAPKSRKHLRGYLFNVFEVARRHGGPWHGRANPIDDVDSIRVPKVPRAILQPEEMEPVLAQVPARWRGAVATTLYAGLREGEVFGLRKQEVDLGAGLLMVSRSWDAPRTKDGKALPVPIAPPLRPYLEEALRSPGEFVFPATKGRMHPRHLRLGKMLRAAIGRAGFIVGYEHRCRAWHCGWRVRAPDAAPPPECPKCHGRATWAKAIPRHVRFHDTRHSFGTQIVRKAGLAVAQLALRHSDSRLTADTYGHLDLEDLRRGVLSAFPLPAGAVAAPPEPAGGPPTGPGDPHKAKKRDTGRNPKQAKPRVDS